MKALRFGLYEIPEEGIEIHSEETARTLDISPEDLILNDKVYVDAHVIRDGDSVFVDGEIKTTVTLVCRRCNREFTYKVDNIFHCHEEPVRKYIPTEEQLLTKADMDIHHYTGDELKIDSLVREQIFLAIPMYPLCKDDCRGLCPVCGQNLNIKSCDCVPEEKENPFSILKQFFH